MRRLAVLSTHPIQYNAPFFRLLGAEPTWELHVFYSRIESEVMFDEKFGMEVRWDIPLTEGYHSSSYAGSTYRGRKQLIQGIRDFAPHALLVYGWNFPGHLAFMRQFHGKIPIWFRGDSTLLDPLPIWKACARWIWLRFVYRHVDVAFYVGTANRAYFEWCGMQDRRLVRAYHAVDNEFFGTRDFERKQAALKRRSDLGIEPNATVFLFVGKFEPVKQPDLLLDAFLSIPEWEGSTIHLILIGSGELLGDLQLKSAGNEHVHILGFKNQTELPVYYRMADILCLPSRSETWGLVVNEFLASAGGLLLLSDRVGCAADLVTRPEHGKVISHCDVSAWSAAMIELSKRPRIKRTDFSILFSQMEFFRALESCFKTTDRRE
jgi:glycosyltransferase involved in cell wall biosynthesis